MLRSHGIGRRTAGLLTGLLLIGALVTVLSGSAQASVPNHWGFAFVTAPSVAGIPPASHQAGSWPPAFKVHTSPGGPGQVVVRFPQVGVKGGVVHVTAVTATAAWCQAQQWAKSGADEVVTVRCYQAPGTPAFVPFVVLFTQSSKAPIPAGRAYGYLRYQPGAGVLTSFSSAGGSNTVTQLGTGLWQVTLHGLGSAGPAGNVQVTPVNPAAPAKCEVALWTSAKAAQLVRVRCYHPGTAPMNTGWTLSYQRGRAITGTQPGKFAYTFDNKPPVAGPYAPAPPALNFNSAGAVNTIVRSGAGLRLVTLPHVGRLPNTVLVTAFQALPGGFCNLISPWATTGPPGNVIVRDVGCYTAAGAPASRASLITYAASG
jgi:hypothetical protein